MTKLSKRLAAKALSAAVLASLALSGAVAAETVPQPVLDSIHGRPVGWARSQRDWFVVYLDHKGSGWCGLQGASWRMALVEISPVPERVLADRGISRADCGNWLAWVRAGRFSDGRHREAAFMLWATPSIGATTYIYRIGGGRFQRLAEFVGDRVQIGRGTVVVSFESRGRSPRGEIKDIYRFNGTRYKLETRR